ncbi:MAG: T9SS type A sorting domain-containing protein [Bacteroidales bacterium]|nr:T9SS type A sorting domain-containing protein [Bacteroidales bacterium]
MSYCGQRNLNQRFFYRDCGQQPVGNEFLLFPNPASNKLFLQSGLKPGDLLQILVFDVHGNLVMLQENPAPNNMHVLEVGHLPKGVYIIQIKGRSLSLTGKFAVM